MIPTAGLQSALFGGIGMRLTSKGLTFNPPPPAASGGKATMVAARSVHFRGSRITWRVRDTTMSVELVEAGSVPLYFCDAGCAEPVQLAAGAPITRPRGKATISTSADTRPRSSV